MNIIRCGIFLDRQKAKENLTYFNICENRKKKEEVKGDYNAQDNCF